jgi:hypothetical protein
MSKSVDGSALPHGLREANSAELENVDGGGWLSVAIGFVMGGPMGAVTVGTASTTLPGKNDAGTGGNPP